MYSTDQEQELREGVLSLISSTQTIFNPEEITNISLSDLLENFVHLDFTEEDATKHWKNILITAEELSEKLGRPVSAHMAAVDYFTSTNNILHSPMLIEVRVFKQTEEMAMIDGLTGIFNRRYMDIMLKKEFNRCNRYGKSLSVCIIDIDNFKTVNDTLGHQFGDTILTQLSQVLKQTIREEDIACRYGGEEFLLILPETDTSGAYILAERIRKDLHKLPDFYKHNITFSAGTATYPTCAMDCTNLIRAADHALYQAKFSGKNKTLCAPVERRRFDRYPQSWNINICYENTREYITSSVTKNISLGGLQFEYEKSLSVDTEIHLEFSSIPPNKNSQAVTVKGKITWIKHQTDNNYLYGITFNDTPENLEQAFEQYSIT